jgi:iron(III) transport system substrate-binding protein
MKTTRFDGSVAARGTISRRSVLKAGAGLGAAFLIGGRSRGAAAGINDELVKAAQDEGTLVYYHTSGIEITQQWANAFTAKYDIPVQAVRGPSYPLFDRWLNEERVGKHLADVIQISDPFLLKKAHQDGFLTDYTPAEGANILASARQDGVWYSLFIDLMGLGYNPNQTTPEESKFLQEQGWHGLADARWNGRYGTTTPASGGSSYAFWYTFMAGFKDQFGDAFIKKLAANKPTIYSSKTPLFERLAAGEYAVADQAAQSLTGTLFLKGAPVRWIYPDPTPANVTAQSISAKAPHPNAARLFQEWATGAEAQAEWLKYASVTPARADVSDPRKTKREAWYAEDWYAEPKNIYLAYLNDAGFAADQKALIGHWNDVFGYQGSGSQ